MPIQIIDNFDLSTQKPIDNRLVVGSQSFYTDKELIPYKYPGMRVWDFNYGVNGAPYVWTGSTFSSETTSGINGSGTVNCIPKFSSSNYVSNSSIYTSGNKVSINTGGGFTSGYSLTVKGGISVVSGYYSGNGSQLTNLDATNITQGLLSLSRISNSSNSNWILTSGLGGSGNAQFVNPSSITVGKATQLENSVSIWGQSFDGTLNVSGDILGAGSIQFGSNINPIKKAIISYPYSTSGVNTGPNLIIPNLLSGTYNFAFLEQAQTFTRVQSFQHGSGDLSAIESTGITRLKGTSTYTGVLSLEAGSTNKVYITYKDGSNPTSATIGFSETDTNQFMISNRKTSGSIIFKLNSVDEKIRIDQNQISILDSIINKNTGDVIRLDGGSSNHSYITFWSDKYAQRHGWLGYGSAASDTLSIYNEKAKSFSIGSGLNNSGGGNIPLNIAINNGGTGAPPEIGAAATYGFYVYSGGWRRVQALGFDTSSDFRLKKDIESITEGSLEKLDKINPVRFKWKSNDLSELGFIAQEVLKVIPECVNGDLSNLEDDLENDKGSLSINTTGIIALLAGAVKELSDKVKNLENKN